MQLSVVIVSYNVKLLLEQCLRSVQKTIAYLQSEAEVVVIDNHSADGSVEYLAPGFPAVKFISNRENAGFAKACNQGIKNSSGKYVLFLNPDTLVPDDCFQKCISFFESHHDAGAVGVRMVNGSGRFLKESKRGFPSPARAFYKLSGLAALFPESKLFAGYYMGHLNEKRNYETDVLSGAFMMVRREVLEQTGYFDESYFMYGEDIDLSYRIQKSGYKNYYLGEICVIHFKGKSTPKRNIQNTRMFYNAMNIFVTRHYSGKTSSITVFFIRTGIELRKAIALTAVFLRGIFK